MKKLIGILTFIPQVRRRGDENKLIFYFLS
jgi:hypothetical protein